MTRIARLVVPGMPHLVTQRGNRREPTFFGDGDYRLYLDLLAEAAHRAGTEIWAYCLMPNHVHLILKPGNADGLRATFADCIAAIPARSMPAMAGPAICGRAGCLGGDGRASPA